MKLNERKHPRRETIRNNGENVHCKFCKLTENMYTGYIAKKVEKNGIKYSIVLHEATNQRKRQKKNIRMERVIVLHDHSYQPLQP